jgi:triphosphatase
VPAPVNTPPKIAADLPLAEASERILSIICAAIDGGWEQFLAHDDARPAHALRVAIRKLKVALRTFRGTKETAADRALRLSLTKTARAIGKVRDLDVLLTDIVPPAVKAIPPDHADALLERLIGERAAALVTARRHLTSRAAKSLRSRLEALPLEVGDTFGAAHEGVSLKRHCRRDLKRRWKRVFRRAAALQSNNTEDLHELRKELKNLRYAFAAVAPLWPDAAAKEFQDAVKRLQATLGAFNDSISVVQIKSRLKAAPDTDDLQPAVEAVMAHHAKAAKTQQRRLPKQWEALKNTKIARRLNKKAQRKAGGS